MSRRRLAAVLAAAAVLPVTACASHSSDGSKLPVEVAGDPQNNGLLGLPIEPAAAKPQITLTDTGGHQYDFAKQTAGRITYLFFGYTHCPDVCPDTMAAMATALRETSAQIRRQVTVVFVSTDPKRDSLPVIAKWLKGFDFNVPVVGLRGSKSQIAAAQSSAHLGIIARREGKQRGAGKYSVTHSSEVLAFGADGLEHVVYTQNPPSDYLNDLSVLASRWA